MKKKTRLLALLLALSVLVALTACGSAGTTTTAEASASEAEETAAEEETAEEAATEESAAETEQDASAQPEESASAQEESSAAEETETVESEEAAAESEQAAAESPEYPLDTDVTLTMVSKLEANMQSVIENFGDVQAMQAYEEATGVSVEFTMLGDMVFDEQLNLLISSDDLPDLIQSGMAGYSTKLSAAITDDVLMDIAPLLEEYAPDYYAAIQADQTLIDNLYNDDGTISYFSGIAIPQVDSGLIVRGDWMDALGLEDPQTISELTDTLRQIQNAYGTSMTLLVNSDLDSGLQRTFNTVVNGFDSLTMQMTDVDSGVVVAGVASDGFKDYLTYLRSLYAEGLINDSFASISKEQNTYNACYWDGDCGVWNEGNRCVDPDEFSNSADPDYLPRAIANITLDDGTGTHVLGLGSSVGRGAIYVTAVCSEPEIALQFLNYAYTEAGIDLVSFGVEGETYERVSEDEVHYTDLISANPDMAEKDAEILYLINNWWPTVQTTAMYNLKNSVEEVRAAAELWSETSGDDSMTLPDAVSLDEEDTETVNTLSADILTLFSEKSALYVMGSITEEEFDQAVEDAYAIGLTEITEIYQAAYDAYLAK